MESFKEKEKSEASKSKTSLKRDQSANETPNSKSGTFITNGVGLATEADEEAKQSQSEKPLELREEQNSQVREPAIPEQDKEEASDEEAKQEHAQHSAQLPNAAEINFEKPKETQEAIIPKATGKDQESEKPAEQSTLSQKELLRNHDGNLTHAGKPESMDQQERDCEQLE